MSVKYNPTAAEALELFLGGAECGLPESLLAKTEKGMDAKIHPTVRKFAAKYFHMIPNSGRNRIGDFHLVHVGSGACATQAAELERLSAKCLWALGRFDEAERLLNSAAAAFTDSLIHTYTALSNMLSECGRAEESESAFDAVAKLSELVGDYDALGMLYQTRAQKLDKDIETIDRAIELYDKAIEQFQKMPKPNKHDIARAQQLRGEARRRKKELSKQDNPV